MAVASLSYSGVTAFKEVDYAQSLGVDADAVAIRIVPQATSIATGGTLTIGYTGQTSITLPNCTLDSARTIYNTEGFITSIVLRDRRELWKYKAPISGRYNIIRNDTRITSSEKTLRELVELLLVALGEATPDVSAVSNTLYPEVNWFCEEPRLALSALLNEWGYGLELGFGSENVTIHEIGTGSALPTDSIMMQSTGVDATIQPQYVRVCYNPSVMQARLELEAVALDTDGAYDLLADVSYKPAAGWETADPNRMETVRQETSEAAQQLALKSVYRVYRVKQFSDGDLVVPDGGATTLTSISQIFPIQNRLLETVTTSSGETEYDKAKIYGVAILPEGATGQPKSIANSSIDDEISADFTIEGERGLVRFREPIYKIVSEEYKPADLYLECTFSVRDNTNNQYAGYSKDVLFDASGTGYAPLKWPTQRGETIVAYSAGHVKNTGSNTTNQTALDSLASTVATAVAGRYTATASQMIVYQYPRLSLRLDGIRQQIRHIISDGEEEPGSYTIASVGMEFDRFTKSRQDRAIRSHAINKLQELTAFHVVSERAKEGND